MVWPIVLRVPSVLPLPLPGAAAAMGADMIAAAATDAVAILHSSVIRISQRLPARKWAAFAGDDKHF